MLDTNDRKPLRLDMVKNVAKFVLPVPARDFLRATHRTVIFRRAMKEFLRDVEQGKPFNRRVLIALIYGWGNESWSSGSEYLAECLEHARLCRGPILECGSGLTTLLIGAVAKKAGTVLCALEHQAEWGHRVGIFLKRYGIDAVQLHIKPLKDYADFTWYDPPPPTAAEKYALVLCDGPPGSTRGGRYGLVPIMKSHLAPGCVILLDDAERSHERMIAKHWAEQLNASYETLGSAKQYIRLTV